MLEGEAGIGKSTLWLAGVEHARARGLRVLSSRPAEAERGLAHVGLGDLFEDVLDDVCPRSRRRGGVRSRSRCSARRRPATPVDHRALGVAVRDVLQLLSDARRRSWLQSTTSSGSTRPRRARLRSRCEGSRRAPFSCCSPGGSSTTAQPSELEQALGPERVQRLPVGPLSVGALHRLLRDRLGKPFARQTLLRIHERSGGNPFFALELARVLDADIDPLEPLPVPETLDELVRARIAGLPAPTREALALASALGHALGVAARAGGRRGRTRSTPAVAAHVIERENGDDPLHPSAAVVGSLRRPGRGAAERSRDGSRDRRRPARSAPVTSRSRRTRPTPTSPPCSTTPRRSRPIAARRPSRPSSPSRRSG